MTASLNFFPKQSASFSSPLERGAQADSVLTASKPYEWILHPVIDVLFCCGGIVWIFFALHYFGFGADSSTKPVQIMALLAALGAIGLSETHVMATLQRVYEKKAHRRKFSLYTRWAAVACLLLGVSGCFFEALIPILLKVYLLFVAQHFTAQTYGLTLLYCAKRGYFLKAWEKQALGILMQSTMWTAVLRQLTFADWGGRNLLGYKLPFWGPLPEWVCHSAEIFVALSAICMIGIVARKFVCEKRLMPIPALMLTITGVSVFMIGKQMSDTLWIYVPAFFHASQYIAVSLAFYLKEKGLPEGVSARRIATQITEPTALKYLGVLLVCAVAFFQIVPWVAGLVGFKSAAVAASSFAALHFHHFLTDSAIWKLKDSQVRKLLVA